MRMPASAAPAAVHALRASPAIYASATGEPGSPGGGTSILAAEASRALADLRRTDWQPLRTERSPWRNPCLLSSLLTGASVVAAARRGLFVPFGVGPLCVLVSSILYWHDPVKDSLRRAIDVKTVRIGLAAQVVLAATFCSPRQVALPKLGLGYMLGMLCYAGGRILTVRGRLWAGACVHCGVHLFANLGNLLILPYASL